MPATTPRSSCDRPLVTDSARPSRRVWFVFPLLALWANVHGSVTLGVALTVLAGFVQILRRRPQLRNNFRQPSLQISLDGVHIRQILLPRREVVKSGPMPGCTRIPGAGWDRDPGASPGPRCCERVLGTVRPAQLGT